MSLRHPEPATVLDFLLGRDVDAADRAHLAACAPCTQRLAKAGRLVAGLQELASQEALEALEAPHPVSAHGTERARLTETASRLATGLLEAAASGNAEPALAELRGHEARGYALLYAAQEGARLAVSEPERAAELAETLAEESHSAPVAPVAPAAIRAEAALLASQALLNLGDVEGALRSVGTARREHGPRADVFDLAVCDYFEAAALSWSGAYAPAERALKGAMRTFARFGQEHWLGRAELALATVLSQRGDESRALAYLGQGLARLDPERDANSLAAGLVNKASTLAHLARYREARATYAQALSVARSNGFTVLIHAVQLGLAELDFLRGDFERALPAYERLSLLARERGYAEQERFALLFAAECHGRLGRGDGMERAVLTLRDLVRRHPFHTPALDELFACLDRGDLEAGLVGHVRAHLERPERAYVAWRRTG